MKKIINVFLIMLLCSVSVFSLEWKLKDGVLTISGEGKIPTFSWNNPAPWEDYRTSITSVIIGDGVQSIGSNVFAGYKKIVSVTIGNKVQIIDDGAFKNCDSLTSVTIPDSVQSIGDYAFENCANLASVIIGNGVRTIGDYSFENCDSLTSLIIPDGVQTIGGGAFRDCDNFASITIPDSVQTIGYFTFVGCNLKSAKIPLRLKQYFYERDESEIEGCEFIITDKDKDIGGSF